MPNGGLPDVRRVTYWRAGEHGLARQEIARVTVSIGVAQFRLAESAEAMVESCDRALYQAKRQGRNQTVIETDIEGEVVAA